MTNSVTIPGGTGGSSGSYNDGSYDSSTNAGGLADGGNVVNWVPMISDVVALLQNLNAPGGVSVTSVAIGTGAKSFTLAAAATMPAGTWVAYRASEGANPVNFMIVTLASALVAGTALSVTSAIAVGSGTYTDWVFAPLGGTRRSVQTKTADYTLVVTDYRATIYMNKASAVVLTLPAISTLGLRFEIYVLNIGAGACAVTPNGSDAIDGGSVGVAISLTQNQGALLEAKAANDWRIVLARGYGSSGLTTTAVKTASGPYQAVANDLVRVDSTSNTVNVNTPASPTDGTKFRVKDVSGKCGQPYNAVLKYDSTNPIMGNSADWPIDTPWFDREFMFSTGKGWS